MFRFGYTVVRFSTKPTIWQRVKNEASHMWAGSKLLVTETRISTKLLRQLLNGNSLTHREHRQLKRTTSDLLRIIPFSVFLIVPFMELLLPIVIKVFPNFLPSTFRDEFKEQENRKKLLGIRLQVAGFLRETLEEKNKGELSDFANLLQNIQTNSNTSEKSIVETPDLLKLCQKFQDNVTLDHLSRPQLISISRYFAIPGIGTTEMIRKSIARHVNKIRQEDSLILKDAERLLSANHSVKSIVEKSLPEAPKTLIEIIKDIPIPELQTMCKERGIPLTSPRRMRLDLSQWVELSVVYDVPNILLVLSRILLLDMQFKTDQSQTASRPTTANINSNGLSGETLSVLQDTLKTLPETVIKETMLDFAREKGEKQVVLDAVKEEMKEIEKEKIERELEEKVRIEENISREDVVISFNLV
eukprot:NODE_41_length_34096_cov_2.002235.p8 type:complete len:416 gc:universal NODE_41_length_34096_cov_2.002235:19686-18439(-)